MSSSVKKREEVDETADDTEAMAVRSTWARGHAAVDGETVTAGWSKIKPKRRAVRRPMSRGI
jgi:hypothetical protein